MKRLMIMLASIFVLTLGLSSMSYAMSWAEGVYKAEDNDTITITSVGEDGIIVNWGDSKDLLFEYDLGDSVIYDVGIFGFYELEPHDNSIGLYYNDDGRELVNEYYPVNSSNQPQINGSSSDGTASQDTGWQKGKYTSPDKMVITITEVGKDGIMLDFDIDEDVFLPSLPFYYTDSSKKTAAFTEESDFTWEITINDGKIYFVEKTEEGDTTTIFIRSDVLQNMSEPEMYSYAMNSYEETPQKYDSTKYPPASAAKREKLYNVLKDYKTGKLSKCYITSKSGKLQESIKDTEYVYYGDMKNSMPDGYGIVCRIYQGENITFAGEFKKGKPSGYGVVYETEKTKLTDIYEGEDCKLSVFITTLQFSASGTGAIYSGGTVPYYNEPRIKYEGKLKDNQPSGKGKEYDRNHKLVYDGNFKDGEYSGKGVLYYEDGKTVKYDGEFKKGTYHGKGTLYNKDGSVKHKGKFKNGDIA